MTGMRHHTETAPAVSGGERKSADQRTCERRTSRETRRDVDHRRAELARAIEGEIIPRLMLAHRLAPADGMRLSDLEVLPETPQSIEDFAKLVVDRDARLAEAHVETLIRMGVALDAVYLELFAPTARHLGVLWEEDLCTFTDVTVGLGCLQTLLRRFSPALPRDGGSEGALRALLLPAPGERHTFGLFMVEEFFRREGWSVVADPGQDEPSIVRLVRSTWFDIIGFSLSCEDLLDPLGSAIRSARRASRNRQALVLVGGKAFADRPELASAVGADGTAADGAEAVREAARRVGSVLRQC